MKRFLNVQSPLLLMSLMVSGQAFAAAPPISDPMMKAPLGSMPGTFPTQVTAANIYAAPAAGSVLGDSGSDNILVKMSKEESGPIKWTESRHNEGEISPLIGPFDRNDLSYYPPTTPGNYRPLESGQPFANTTLGWRVNQQTGALLGTVRTNGVNNQDTFNSVAVGITHGVAYFNQTLAQGWGYRMNDGVFNNGDSGSSDLQMGFAGEEGSDGEATFNTAAAYFPYEQGWTGAWVNSGLAEEATFSGSTPGFATSNVVWGVGVADVSIPSVNSATDGMLFVAPSHDNNATNIAAAYPRSGGWRVAVREDEDLDFTGATTLLAENSFQFLYVSYSAPGLIGAQIDGDNAAKIHSAGDSRFTLNRTSAGTYALTVLAANGIAKLSEKDGMLILSEAQSLPGNADIPDRKFLSYEYQAPAGDFDHDKDVDNADLAVWSAALGVNVGGDADNDGDSDGADFLVWQRNRGNGGTFIIESRELVATNSPNSQNQFGNDLALRDSDFYFAWIDFNNPLTPSALPAAGAVPEPGSIVLLLMAVTSLAAVRKRIG